MPLVRISLKRGKSDAYVQAVADGVHEAMTATIHVPDEDRFQIISEHEEGRLITHPSYLGIARTENAVIVQITMLAGRTTEQKQALYRRIAENLQANPGVRREDVMVVASENGADDWSFGNGEAQFASRTYEELRGKGKPQ
ncbi:tautomerase family protein [Capsulimonas corticalis]|uniref:Tautomerase family protein n=2 Tax=Capsulimonas corticalis TaxID=2219043 RepID=A0A402CTG8_9BACT|nr:tautomerase family protein [Capsulimonas corticalis]